MLAPFAVRVTLCPKQIAELLVVIDNEGKGTTTTLEFIELVQVPLLPIRAYTVLTVGETAAVEPVEARGFHV